MEENKKQKIRLTNERYNDREMQKLLIWELS